MRRIAAFIAARLLRRPSGAAADMVAVSQGRTLYVSANSVCPVNSGPPAACQLWAKPAACC